MSPLAFARERMDRVRVLLITDPAYADERIVDVINVSVKAFPKGTFAVQLRDKVSPPARVQAFAVALRAFTVALDVPFLVNGDPDLATGIGADGVHLGRDAFEAVDLRALTPTRWLSIAAHDDNDVTRAVRANAAGVLVSPVFTSGSKTGRGVEAIASARALVDRAPAEGRPRLFALGGIDAANARACMDAGADAVAVIRALLSAPDVDAAARALAASVA